MLDKTVHLFAPPDAYAVETMGPEGVLFPGTGTYTGENREQGALLTYVINRPAKTEEAKPAEKVEAKEKKGKTAEPKPAPEPIKKDDKSKVKYDSVSLEVFDASGEKIRTLKRKAPEDNGINRMTWGLDEKGPQQPSREKPRRNIERGGLTVQPGTYKLRITFGGQKDSTMISVKHDPRFKGNEADVKARYDLLKQVNQLTELTAQATERIRESLEIVNDYEKRLKEAKRDDLKPATEKTKVIKDSLNNLMDYIVGKEDKRQGITRQADPTPVNYIRTASSYIGRANDAVSATDQRVLKQAEDKVAEVLARVNNFFLQHWVGYRAEMEKVNINPFKDYEPLKKN